MDKLERRSFIAVAIAVVVAIISGFVKGTIGLAAKEEALELGYSVGYYIGRIFANMALIMIPALIGYWIKKKSFPYIVYIMTAFVFLTMVGFVLNWMIQVTQGQ